MLYSGSHPACWTLCRKSPTCLFAALSNPDCVNGLLSSSHLTFPLIYIVLFLFLSGLCEPFFHYYNIFFLMSLTWYQTDIGSAGQTRGFPSTILWKLGGRDLGLCYSEQQSQQQTLCRLAWREPLVQNPSLEPGIWFQERLFMASVDQ